MLISDRVVVAGSADRITSMTDTSSGYAAVVGNDILYLGPDASLVGHQPLPAAGAMVAAGAAAYQEGGTVYFQIEEAIPRRRAAR